MNIDFHCFEKFQKRILKSFGRKVKDFCFFQYKCQKNHRMRENCSFLSYVKAYHATRQKAVILFEEEQIIIHYISNSLAKKIFWLKGKRINTGFITYL